MNVFVVLPYGPAPFMQADVDLLRRHFEVDVVVHERRKVRLVTTVLRRLRERRPEILLLWFVVPSYALALTLLGRTFGAKVVFVTGGYDVASIPSIGYGAMRFRLFRTLIRPTLAFADLVLPFSHAAADEVRRRARPPRVEVVYPGIDTDFFSPSRLDEREPLALTVSPVTQISILQKGLDTFVEAARHAPEVRFVLVGASPDSSLALLRAAAPANVEFVDRFLAANELRDLYRRASCYVQASLHEGFGIAVAEAMACGAVPVVTEIPALVEVTGGLGQYLRPGDPAAAAAAALRSLRTGTDHRQRLRQRVLSRFSADRREEELVDALCRLSRGDGGHTPSTTHGDR